MTSSRLTLLTLAFFMLLAVSCGGGKNQKAPEVTAPTATIDLMIEGMTCTGCENTISSNLEKLPGIKSVTASHTKGNAIIEYEPDMVDTVRIKETVDGLGYRAVKVSLPEGSDTE